MCPQKIPVRENTVNLKIFQNIGIFSFAKVVNSLILKIQDIAIFAMKLSKLVWHIKLSLISEIGTGKISSWTGGNLETRFEWGPCILTVHFLLDGGRVKIVFIAHVVRP